MSEMMESLLGLLFLIIGLFVYFYYFSTFGKYRRWLKKNAGKSSYNDVIVRDILKNIGSNFEYSTENIPYGRSKWFINSSEYFTSVVNNIDGIEFYGYSPIRSSEEEKMIEYGVLLCQSGIFIKNEATNNDFYVPFSGLWKIVNKDNEVLFYYPYSIKKLEFPSSKIDLKSMTNSISALISTRYTTDLKIYEETELISERKFFQNIKLSNFSKNMLTSSIYSLNSSLLGHLHLKQFNSIVSGSAGHGHAAEYANDLIDKIKYPFKNVKQTGQDNAKNGADRRVGSNYIQTKYYSSARNSVNAAFESKANGGMYRYNGMQLEVPKDQYSEAVSLMKKKIQDGKVKGITDPNEASKIIRKGNITYQDAKLIAKGGNLTSIKYDTIDGAVQSLPIAGISFAIVYAQAIWSGEDQKTAVKYAIETGLRTLVLGTIVYASSQQIGKVLTSHLATYTGKKVIAENVAKRAGTVIAVGVVIVPDLFDSLTGRISSQQLLKNTLVAGSGIAGGAMVGSLFGGPVGTLVGGLVGAIASSSVAQAVLDQFIEDDRVEMFAILKEEFIDVVMSMSLTKKEFQDVQDKIFNGDLQNRLKEIHQNKKAGCRKYTRENIVEKITQDVISKRRKISKEEIIEAVRVAENSFEVVL